MAKRILIRKDTAQNWYDNNPMLYPGEFGVETDTLKIKMNFFIWYSRIYFF